MFIYYRDFAPEWFLLLVGEEEETSIEAPKEELLSEDEGDSRMIPKSH